MSLVQSVSDHADAERVIGGEVDLLSPMMVEEVVSVETYELVDQSPICIIQRRSDPEVGNTKELRKIVKPKRHLTQYTEASPAAALQRLKQIRVSAGIGDAYLAVICDYFGFQQASGC